MKDSAPYEVRAVERAARLLDALAAADEALTLSAIAAAAELSVPTTFRLLSTLRAQGLVVRRDADGRYALGFRLLELSRALLRQLDVVDVARPYLAAVRSRLDETTGLCVRSGDLWVHVAQAEAARPLRRVMAIGEPAPLYVAAPGRLFLAALPSDELEAYLTRTAFVRLSPTTPVDAEVLRERVARARAEGYAESVNERGAGGAAVAAPIYGHDGRLAAVFEISGPATRFTPETRPAWVAAALEAAAEISRRLGHGAPVQPTTGVRSR